MKKGEITAYFALVFLLLLSFITAIMDAASLQMAKSYKRADMNRAIESVFAEYQKNLLEEFGIFGIEAGYESGMYDEQKVLDRIQHYGGGSNKINVERIRLMTDQGGKSFYEQAVTYMKKKTGLSLVESNVGMTNNWGKQQEDALYYEEEEKKTGQELEQVLAESETSLPEEDNPISSMNNIKSLGLSTLVMPKDKTISDKSLPDGGREVVSNRNLQTGYGEFPEFEREPGTVAKLLFGEYVMNHFTSAASEEMEGGLSYELEYILYGKSSDRENLEAVVKKLVLLRFVPNYIYLQSDAQKKAEVDALALTLSTLAAMPAAQGIVAQAILLAWAFGESLMDVRTLLKGSKVPVTKSAENWQLSLTGLMKIGTHEDTKEAADGQSGMTYDEYLRILLFLEQKEELVMRSMDMVENRLKTEKGLTWFQLDACVTNMDVRIKTNLRRGITYEFPILYGYR